MVPHQYAESYHIMHLCGRYQPQQSDNGLGFGFYSDGVMFVYLFVSIMESISQIQNLISKLIPPRCDPILESTSQLLVL